MELIKRLRYHTTTVESRGGVGNNENRWFMRLNEPVTNTEVELKEGMPLVSRTDPSGRITFVNKAFIEISGFDEQGLVGALHNIVRHPHAEGGLRQPLDHHQGRPAVGRAGEEPHEAGRFLLGPRQRHPDRRKRAGHRLHLDPLQTRPGGDRQGRGRLRRHPRGPGRRSGAARGCADPPGPPAAPDGMGAQHRRAPDPARGHADPHHRAGGWGRPVWHGQLKRGAEDGLRGPHHAGGADRRHPRPDARQRSAGHLLDHRRARRQRTQGGRRTGAARHRQHGTDRPDLDRISGHLSHAGGKAARRPVPGPARYLRARGAAAGPGHGEGR